MDYSDVFIATAVAVAALMTTTWIVSLVLRDASIVDIIWGAGFVLVAWVALARSDGDLVRSLTLAVVTTAWGLRLSGYLAWRNLGHGEDYRYQKMRSRWGRRFPIVSLFTVFALQGVLMWVVSLPVQMGQVGAAAGGRALLVLGATIAVLGIGFESIGDVQLARFKADPANQGKVMDRGLWRYTRHPNYFGDFCVWWGLWLVAASSLDAVVAGVSAVGPVVMSILLTRVSGAALLERSLKSRRPGYEEYVRRTSGFFPWPPRSDS